MDGKDVAQNEDFWGVIQRGYSVSTQINEFEQWGRVAFADRGCRRRWRGYNQLTNEGPSYFMWQILDEGREPLRAKLARLAGASPEEIAINRNTTEALNTIIYGLPAEGGR